jgi:hypothetical protein
MTRILGDYRLFYGPRTPSHGFLLIRSVISIRQSLMLHSLRNKAKASCSL